MRPPTNRCVAVRRPGHDEDGRGVEDLIGVVERGDEDELVAEHVERACRRVAPLVARAPVDERRAGRRAVALVERTGRVEEHAAVRDRHVDVVASRTTASNCC